LENFLTNALKATTAAENHAPVIVRIADLGGEKMRVLVEDSGIKIPATLAKSLFDQPVTSSESGWGKGLYYSRLRVEPFNGSLDWFAGVDTKTFYLEIG
jgi:sensor histidine kinase regulating citrate/malate metabolism